MDPVAIDRLLASPTRRRIVEIVEAKPGVSMSELARGLGLYWTAVASHVDQLSAAGLVRAIRVGRQRVLFPSSVLEQAEDPSVGSLGEAACRQVALAIVDHPGCRVWELCEHAQMSERAVYHHVKRLVDADLVESTSSPGYRGLRGTPKLLACLARRASRDPP